MSDLGSRGHKSLATPQSDACDAKLIALYRFSVGRRRLRGLGGGWLKILGALLVGYAFLGRRFAGIGIGPVYVGEIVLVLGLPFLLLRQSILRLPRISFFWTWLAFALVGFNATIPYVQQYGTDALRDAVIWGYGLFAVIVCLVLLHQKSVETVPFAFQYFIQPFLIWVPIATFLQWQFSSIYSGGVLLLKSGDAAVHVAGSTAFVLLGLQSRTGPIRKTLFVILFFAAFFLLSSQSRGAFITMLVGIAVVAVGDLKRTLLKVLIGGAVALTAVLAIMLIEPEARVGPTQRAVSFEQIKANALSIFSSSDEPYLNGTKSWRLLWWRDIVNYTIYGDYIWTGKGFGRNLADEDGYQVTADHSLRSPHNAGMTVLARMGLPGLATWVLLQATFSGRLIILFRRSNNLGDVFFARLTLWVLAYWAAAIVNMSFDPYLESPYGGIWFWSIMGFGTALVECHRYRRDRFGLGASLPAH